MKTAFQSRHAMQCCDNARVSVVSGRQNYRHETVNLKLFETEAIRRAEFRYRVYREARRGVRSESFQLRIPRGPSIFPINQRVIPDGDRKFSRRRHSPTLAASRNSFVEFSSSFSFFFCRSILTYRGNACVWVYSLIVLLIQSARSS